MTMTKKRIQSMYDEEFARIKALGEHPQAESMALNELRRWLDAALSQAVPDAADEEKEPLGTRLRDNIQRVEREKQEAEAAKQKALERRRMENREKCISWFNRWSTDIAAEIDSGRVPHSVRVPKHIEGESGWKGSINEPGNDNHWLWREIMTRWARQEGLELIITHEHDGMGMESWRELRVKPR
jgi:hypothetical protein